MPRIETAADFPEYTIFRPEQLAGAKRPIVVWANGGCSKNGTLFAPNDPVGHLATYSQENGGESARVGIGWLKWQLYGDQTAAGKGMFAGADCELCKNSMWTVKKNMD